MRDPGNDHLSWSLGLDGAAAARAFDELVELDRELIMHGFPPSRGYEAQVTRLHGPLEGVRWRVTRGPFAAELGLQRFVRAHAAKRPGMVELRVVAWAGQRDVDAPDPDALERRVVAWAMAGWGLGSVALGGLLLGASGSLAAWAQVLLLVPAVAAWRACVTTLVRRAGRSPRALPGSPTRALPGAVELPPQVEDGLRRWRELLPLLRAQRDRLERAGGLAPFRELALEAEPAPPRALAVGASLTAYDAPASDASDRAAAPPRRTTHTPSR
ncbi:MAG: hypothetical protein H6712_18380 [Myxococcales bacterium]|nr:hypothetical protein [Myxococcales bacterium]MCB9715840.1 hypothetical protein [Myxococcales bacterium]